MQFLAKLHQASHSHEGGAHQTRGLLLDQGWRYDLAVWFFDRFLVGGRISELRRTMVDRAGPRAGEAVLDVGCGTGSLALALAAARRSDPTAHVTAHVTGVDPAPRQLARARAKAKRAGVSIEFQPGVIEQLPFADASFDVVTSSLMMHHLPDDLKTRGLDEIHRVVKPGGRLVVADFDYADDPGPRDQPARNGFGGTGELPDLIRAAGFDDLHFDHLDLPKQHRGWSGITITAASKPE